MAARYFDTVTASDEARFWAKVDRRNPNECWMWLGAKRPAGYGTIYIGGMVVNTTHVALFLDGRPRPLGEANHALHSCDNPSCVNPAHLRWGTVLENAADKMERDPESFSRGNLRGEQCGRAKLTEEDVRMIRSSDVNGAELGRRLGVAKTTICDIRHRRIWAHVC